jgi:hypothetical protein
MSLILDKLVSAWVPQSVIDTLSAKFGDGLIDEIQQNGLKVVAEKAGIDLSSINLPDIDFSGLMEMKDQAMGMAADVMGKTDTDGDGKTGLAEVTDTLGDIADKAWLGGVVDAAKDIVAEARGVDVDGDGKTGLAEAAGQAKEAVAEIKEAVASSPVGERVADLAGDAKDAVMNTEIWSKMADVAENVTDQGGGFLAKLKSFLGV